MVPSSQLYYIHYKWLLLCIIHGGGRGWRGRAVIFEYGNLKSEKSTPLPRRK